jgi:hypothetical protein
MNHYEAALVRYPKNSRVKYLNKDRVWVFGTVVDVVTDKPHLSFTLLKIREENGDVVEVRIGKLSQP